MTNPNEADLIGGTRAVDSSQFVQVRSARSSYRGGLVHNSPIDCTTRAVYPNSASDVIAIVVTEISVVVHVILFLLVFVDIVLIDIVGTRLARQIVVAQIAFMER